MIPPAIQMFTVFIALTAMSSALTAQSSTPASQNYQIKIQKEPEIDPNEIVLVHRLAEKYDPNCAKWDGDLCEQCAPRSYMKNGKCTRVSDMCKDYDENNGKCISCYGGYFLTKEGECKSGYEYSSSEVTFSYANPLCAKWQGQKCIRCSPNSFLNTSGRCQQVNPNCKTYSQKNGECNSCYGGYQVVKGNCVVVKQIIIQNDDSALYNKNPLCGSWKKGVCIKCSPRSYLNPDGICAKVSDLCDKFDQQSGNCLTCFSGYTQREGKCVPEKTQIRDPLCVSWDQVGFCIKCANRAYFNNKGQCIQVSPQCKTYSSLTGQCFECYDGYSLSDNRCVIETVKASVNPANSNPYCAKFDRVDQNLCLKCAPGSYMQKGLCILPDPQCRVFDDKNGSCLSCYVGYTLINNVCYLSSNILNLSVKMQNRENISSQITVFGCQDRQGNKCIRCKQNYTLFGGNCYLFNYENKNRMRSKELLYCLKWQKGYCLECVEGLINKEGVCYCPQ